MSPPRTFSALSAFSAVEFLSWILAEKRSRLPYTA